MLWVVLVNLNVPTFIHPCTAEIFGTANIQVRFLYDERSLEMWSKQCVRAVFQDASLTNRELNKNYGSLGPDATTVNSKKLSSLVGITSNGVYNNNNNNSCKGNQLYLP